MNSGKGGIRYNDSAKKIQVMDTNNNWIDWRPFDASVMNSISGITMSILNYNTRSTTWSYSEIYSGNLLYVSAYSSSANNHAGSTQTISFIEKTSNYTTTFSHVNGTSGKTEAITVEFIFSEGFKQIRYKLTTYDSYTTQYGANLKMTCVFANY